ncbi:MAG: Phenylalanine-tRNA ligase alpha subunit, partial [Parcubacteria group bacterium GW2011_GWC1_43_12]
PIRIISPGIVYRYEATDASHDIEFWQLEGLMVDHDVTIANFKAVIERFFSDAFWPCEARSCFIVLTKSDGTLD